ncbi:hypothetical protein AGDE_14753 [Angomonas deanei]|uniref:Uncharacterized protein n=1 Tax=Angomonas deanei TaxID=59799 RepID=A0A7G2C6X1_9TRYP|nr:hypothetical protein AGDE_14753 [Angomonas deanei]CAD2214547.1 hypothetical protein, conserved [Angomonas deanei]|eukprot:EPY20287.1 hypothetical protein AGDE_14753 [Angomonas deanei]
MKYAEETEEGKGGTETEASASTPKYSWCACCRPPADAENNTNPSVQRIRAAARQVSPLYHHGYEYAPQRRELQTTNRSGRVPQENFVLHDVEAVRQLFKIEVLPASNKGVSYVRNYILHVLVPRDMSTCAIDRTGHLEELNLFEGVPEQAARVYNKNNFTLSKENIQSVLVQHGLDVAGAEKDAPADVFLDGLKATEQREITAKVLAQMEKKAIPHSLMGMYWVLDDDIYSFSQSFPVETNSPTSDPNNNNNNNSSNSNSNHNEDEEDELINPTGPSKNANRKNVAITCREMFREVERRIMKLRENAIKANAAAANNNNTNSNNNNDSSSGLVNNRLVPSNACVFLSKEDMVLNNTIPSNNVQKLNIHNFTEFPNIAIYSLEYTRFAYVYDEKAVSINSYANIACLFNYALVHNPPSPHYFPPVPPRGVRPPHEVLVGYIGNDMLWYRFAVREDYDINLQLIARGLFTVRFRNLSFDVPQMGKVRGGLTDYYRTCQEEIKKQNQRFLLQWPSIAVSCVKGKNATEREDIRIRWDLVHPSKIRYPGAQLYLSGPLPQIQASRAVPAPSEGKTPMTLPDFFSKRPREAEELPLDDRLHRTNPPNPIYNNVEQRAAAAAPPAEERGGPSSSRDLPLGEALRVGLTPIPFSALQVGKIVCMVPSSPQHPPSGEGHPHRPKRRKWLYGCGAGATRPHRGKRHPKVL